MGEGEEMEPFSTLLLTSPLHAHLNANSSVSDRSDAAVWSVATTIDPANSPSSCRSKRSRTGARVEEGRQRRFVELRGHVGAVASQLHLGHADGEGVAVQQLQRQLQRRGLQRQEAQREVSRPRGEQTGIEEEVDGDEEGGHARHRVHDALRWMGDERPTKKWSRSERL